jgi:hypothetical protein
LADSLSQVAERRLFAKYSFSYNSRVNFAAELEASLKEFLTSGMVDLNENGGRTSLGDGLSWEVRGESAKPLLHLWSERFNLTRRVLAITDHSEQRLALAVERFGRAKPDRLEFVRREFERGARQLSHEEFRERLSHLLAEQFPDETVESLTISADLEHSLSGNYARGLPRRGSLDMRLWLCLAVNHQTPRTTASRLRCSGSRVCVSQTLARR